MTFKELLLEAGLTKAELSRRLGLNPRSVSDWGNEPPKYATAYIDLLIAYRRIK